MQRFKFKTSVTFQTQGLEDNINFMHKSAHKGLEDIINFMNKSAHNPKIGIKPGILLE